VRLLWYISNKYAPAYLEILKLSQLLGFTDLIFCYWFCGRLFCRFRSIILFLSQIAHMFTFPCICALTIRSRLEGMSNIHLANKLTQIFLRFFFYLICILDNVFFGPPCLFGIPAVSFVFFTNFYLFLNIFFRSAKSIFIFLTGAQYHYSLQGE